MLLLRSNILRIDMSSLLPSSCHSRRRASSFGSTFDSALWLLTLYYLFSHSGLNLVRLCPLLLVTHGFALKYVYKLTSSFDFSLTVKKALMIDGRLHIANRCIVISCLKSLYKSLIVFFVTHHCWRQITELLPI